MGNPVIIRECSTWKIGSNVHIGHLSENVQVGENVQSGHPSRMDIFVILRECSTRSSSKNGHLRHPSENVQPESSSKNGHPSGNVQPGHHPSSPSRMNIFVIHREWATWKIGRNEQPGHHPRKFPFVTVRERSSLLRSNDHLRYPWRRSNLVILGEGKLWTIIGRENDEAMENYRW